MFCVAFIVATASVDIVQYYCLALEYIVVTATVDIVQWYCVCLDFIEVTATVDIVQCYCVLCGGFCGYSKSIYSTMILCCVWSLLWLQQQ